ncbi:MAG: hypothetical protein KDD02_20745 [Phaeodactylibacter sp.]|nr:hypothetical protein [Phaeodactylibacter sp.]MCB9303283.1 hypothetical protein [Lewinellaceae bacterium]
MPAGLAHCESLRLAISLLVQSENPVSANEPERVNWRLFPNPTSGEMPLEGIATAYLDGRLFSMDGRQLAQLFKGSYQDWVLFKDDNDFKLYKVKTNGDSLSMVMLNTQTGQEWKLDLDQ